MRTFETGARIRTLLLLSLLPALLSVGAYLLITEVGVSGIGSWANGASEAATSTDAGPPAPDKAPPSPARSEETGYWSSHLGREMSLSVYLPPGYDSEPDQRFPVLYMLHAMGGKHTDWQQLGLFTAATRLIESGQIPPMIIISPDGERGYWLDHFNKGPRFGSYISKGLVAHVDTHYRSLPRGDFRAIGGTSMGGHGALQLAMNNPGVFSIVGAHSVALRAKHQAFEFFGDQQYFEGLDPVSIISKNRAATQGLTIWIDIGRSDHWYGAANAFHELLLSLEVPHTWRVWEGGHDAAYCKAHVEDYLRFYGAAFASRFKEPLQ